MKSITKFLIIPLFLVTACVDSLDDYNIDQKNASVVTAEPLFTSAVKSFADIIATPNVNSNNYKLYIQHWTTTQYLDEPRYILTSRLIPQNFWDAMYRDVLSDLKEATRILEADQLLNEVRKKNQLGQIGIIEAYAWLVLVNTYGNIPYSEAFNANIALPKYDDAQEVYTSAMQKLDASLAMLDNTSTGFGIGDVLFSGAGQINNWIEFGNSIKLKMAMVLVDFAGTKSMAESAVAEAAPLAFNAPSDKARFPYIADPPNNNPVSANLNAAFTARRDFVGSKTLIDLLKVTNDPRLPQFFNPKAGTTEYEGGYYGYTNNPVADFSEISDKVKAANFEYIFIDYAEVALLRAEAIERGIITGDAADEYKKGISASIAYWTGTADESVVDAYLAHPEVAYNSGNWKEVIGTQKWITLFTRGWDAWLEWRKLDFPVLLTPDQITPPAGQDAPAPVHIPVRMIYPINEQTLNGTNRTAASDAIGGDDATTKLFWDVN